MNKKDTLTHLQFNADWLASVRATPTKLSNQSIAVNLRNGCYHLLSQVPNTLLDWLSRKPGRKDRLKRVEKTYNQGEGNKDLLALVTLTESAVLACNWVDKFTPGPLPFKKLKTIGAEQIAKMRAGKATAKKEDDMLKRKLERLRVRAGKPVA